MLAEMLVPILMNPYFKHILTNCLIILIPCTLNKLLNEKSRPNNRSESYTLSHDFLYTQVNERIKNLNIYIDFF